MNYADIKKLDVANGFGVRVSLFVSGCYHKCKGCFNHEYQSFDSGRVWTQKEEDIIIEYLKNDIVRGFSLLGGEPFHQKDISILVKLLSRIKKEFPHKDIWVWSGCTYEEIVKDGNKIELLKLCDVLIDGKYEEDKKDLNLRFRGSSNQDVLLIQESLKQNKKILYDKYMK